MLALSIPTVALSGMFAMILGYPIPHVPGVQWVSPVLGTVMYAWGGRPFLSGAASEIRSRRPGMMLLIALAITVAFVSSWGAVLGLLHHELDFWWELALLVVIMLLGHWIEMRSLAQATSALDSLAALLPDQAERVGVGPDGEVVTTVTPADLVVGDVAVVRPGTVRRGVGDAVVAGTVATDSGIRVEVTAVGADTALAGIQRLVTEAQNSTSRAQRLADRAAAWLFWFALGSAAVTAVVWAVVGSPQDAVVRAITVLVIACPHALGLAIPLVVSIATERAARGEPAVAEIAAVDGRGDRVLVLAAAAESDSEHPLARAIVGEAAKRGLAVPNSSQFRSTPAVGVTAVVEGHEVRVGGPALLEEAGQAELHASRHGSWTEPSCSTCWSTAPWRAHWRWPTRYVTSPGRQSRRCRRRASRSS